MKKIINKIFEKLGYIPILNYKNFQLTTNSELEFIPLRYAVLISKPEIQDNCTWLDKEKINELNKKECIKKLIDSEEFQECFIWSEKEERYHNYKLECILFVGKPKIKI